MNVDRMIVGAQIGLSVLFLVGYFLVIILFMLGYASIPVDYKEAFAGLLSLMTGGGLTVLYFWFQRTRAGGISDPMTTTITTQTPPPPAPQVTTVTMNPEPSNDPSTLETIVRSDRDAADAERVRDAERTRTTDIQPESTRRL